MKRFCTLEYKSRSTKDLQKFMMLLRKSEHHVWRYDEQTSRDVSLGLSVPSDSFSSFKANTAQLYNAEVKLLLSDCSLRVINIISQKVPYLGMDKYNQVINAFAQFASEVLKASNYNGITVELTSAERTIFDIANKETAEKLMHWESLCNHGDGGFCHPYDRERWFEFVETAVLTESELTVGDLEQWLVEERNWVATDDIDNQVVEVGLRYESGRDLLEHYIEHYKK